MSRQPSGARVIGACLTAALFAAGPTIFFGAFAIFVLPIAFIVALAHALLIGLPAYFVLRQRRRLDWTQVLIAGFLVGSVPVGLWQLVVVSTSPYAGEVMGFWMIGTCLVTGVLGMLGGAGFRLVVGPPVERLAQTAAVFE